MAERNAMIDGDHALSISRQAPLAGMSRGSVYAVAPFVSVPDLVLMRRRDALHLEHPFMGARMLRDSRALHRRDRTRPQARAGVVQFLGDEEAGVNGTFVLEWDVAAMTADQALNRKERRPRSPRVRPSITMSCVVALNLALVLTPLAMATEVAVVPIDGPNASATELHGITHTGQLVGTFRDDRGIHGLICTPSMDAVCTPPFLTSLDLWFNGAKAVSTQIQGITSAGQMAGFYLDVTGASHGFLCAGFPTNLDCRQVDVTIDHVLMVNTLILGIQEHGQFVGSYRDAQSRIHGYLSTEGNFSRIDVPGALATVVTGVAMSSGKTQAMIVGFFLDAKFSMHGFLCLLPLSQHCFTLFDVTLNGILQSMTQATGINTQQIVGSFRDPSGQAHGFLCVLPVTSTCFTQLDVRNGTHTEIMGLNDRGQVVGHFRDPTGLQHGFTMNWVSLSHP